MRMTGVKHWLTGPNVTATGQYSTADAVLAAVSVLDSAGLQSIGAPAAAPLPWTADRIAVVEGLWGEGFLSPGGALEILRYARPLGFSTAASLLLAGAGAGGPAIAIARQLGILVGGFESDPKLAALAADRAGTSGLGRRVQVSGWDPNRPAFPPRTWHHGLALEPLRGAHAEPVLAAIGESLKPGGQLLLLESVADAHLKPVDAAGPLMPSEATITRTLGRLGFDVRNVEDLSERHAHLAVLGWKDAARRMRGERPSPAQAALLVQEAEAWCYRLQLLREGRQRLMSWHAVHKAGHSAAASG